MKEKPVVVRVELPFLARVYLWGYFLKIVVKYGIVALAIVGIAAFFALASLPDESKPQFMLNIKQHLIERQRNSPAQQEQRHHEELQRRFNEQHPTGKPVD